MPTIISNEDVAISSQAAYLKYKMLGYSNASLMFAFEFQGYVKFLVENKGMTFNEAVERVLELPQMLRKAQKEEEII